MVAANGLVELDGKDKLALIGVLLTEKTAIVRSQFVEAASHHLLSRLVGKTEVIVSGSAISVGNAVILAVSTLEQTELSLQHIGGPLVHTISAYPVRESFNRLVDVFKHIGHNQFPAVARLVQILIGGAWLLFVPRNVTELLNFLEIELRAEELCQGGIFLDNGLIAALVHIPKHSVDLTEHLPIPAADSSS